MFWDFFWGEIMRKGLLLSLLVLFSTAALAAVYVYVDVDGNVLLKGTGGTDFQSCVNACQADKAADVATCDDTIYFGDPRCSACGGGIQAISGACVPSTASLDDLTECLYTSCLDDALGNYQRCFQGCRQDYPRPTPSRVGGAQGIH